MAKESIHNWAASIACFTAFITVLGVLAGCGGEESTPAPVVIAESAAPDPVLQQWSENMQSAGKDWGGYLNPASGHTFNERFHNVYYDARYVFFQIAEFTGENEPWLTYADYAGDLYVNEYLRPNNFVAAGFQRFPHGIYFDMVRGGDSTLADLISLRDKPPWSRGAYYNVRDTYRGEFEYMSREVAYAIQSHIYAEKAGAERVEEQDILGFGKPTLHWLVEYTASHLHEWRTQQFASDALPNGGSTPGRFAPFMFGLTAHALIEFYDWEVQNGRDPNAYWPTTHWPDIQAALADVASWAFNAATVRSGAFAGERMWVSDYPGSDGYGAFRYEDYNDGGPARDLNLLIAPAYAWLYAQTGEVSFRDMATEIFAAGVHEGKVNGYFSGKQFNQNYRWSFAYWDWLARGDQKN